MSAKIFQLHKRSVYVFDAIQDKYSFDLSQTLFAISDGATQGYKSEIWAKLLVDLFIKSPVFDPEQLINHFTQAAKGFEAQDFSIKTDNPALRLAEERKKQQGAFATFMGIQLTEGKLQYISSGDVCGFLLREGKLFAFPHHTIDELDNDKGFLGTRPLLNQSVSPQQFKTGNIALSPHDTLLLATDALARLLLRDQEEADELLSLSSFEEFHRYIMKQWEQKRLEEDDITLCIITPSVERTVSCYLPPKEFSFPKEEAPNYEGIISSSTVGNLESAKKEIIRLQQQLVSIKNSTHQLQIENKKLKKISIALGILSVLMIGYASFKKTTPIYPYITPINSNSKVISGEAPKGSSITVYANEKELIKNNLLEDNTKWEYKEKTFPAGTKIRLYIKNKNNITEVIQIVSATQADTIKILHPNKIEVKNKKNLSSSDLENIRKAIIEKNKDNKIPKDIKIEIEKESVLIIFSDKSVHKISFEDLIIEKKSRKPWYDYILFWKN